MNISVYTVLIALLTIDGTIIPINSTISLVDNKAWWKPGGQKDSFHNAILGIKFETLQDTTYFERIY